MSIRSQNLVNGKPVLPDPDSGKQLNPTSAISTASKLVVTDRDCGNVFNVTSFIALPGVMANRNSRMKTWAPSRKMMETTMTGVAMTEEARIVSQATPSINRKKSTAVQPMISLPKQRRTKTTPTPSLMKLEKLMMESLFIHQKGSLG